MNQHYYTFNFDEQMVYCYERKGECNGCGLCCEYVIMFDTENRGQGQDNPILGWDPRNGSFNFYDQGVTNAVFIGGRWRYFRNVRITDEHAPCKDLTEDKRCRIHIGKTLLSRMWPLSPQQAAHWSECSYSFEEVGRWTMAEWWAE